VRSRDQIGQLAVAFNQMSAELMRFRALDADKLQRTCQTTQTAIDSLPDGVIMVDQNGHVELANQTASRVFGITAGQALLEDRAPWLREAIQQPSPTFDSYRTSVEMDDGGNRRHFLPQSVALHAGDGRVIGTTVILTDVTDFRRLDQVKDSLLSMASHELKTPLQCMGMVLPFILEQRIGALNDEQVELLTAARDASERMRRIVEKILDLGRLKSGKVPINAEAVPPRELIEKAVSAHQASFRQQRVELRIEVADDLPAAWCDPIQIDHVLSNLLSNALRHTPAGRQVTIAAECHGESVLFDVTDTGCGIEAAHLARVFETFYRVPGQPSTTGTGLGLALVKQIVESHGGRVGVESVVNHGATFSFTLPVARERAAAAPTSELSRSVRLVESMTEHDSAALATAGSSNANEL
jgi:signal transduction histidine kinase